MQLNRFIQTIINSSSSWNHTGHRPQTHPGNQPEGLFTPPVLLRYGLAVLAVLVLPQIIGSLSGNPVWQIDGPAQSGLALVAGLLATISLIAAAEGAIIQSQRAQLAWRFLTGAAACFALGRAAWLIWPEGAHAGGMVPNGIFDLLFSMLFFTGVLLLPVERIPLRSLAHRSLDIVLVVASSFFIKWLYYVRPLLDAADLSPLGWFTQTIHPLGDSLVLWAVILLIMRPYPPHYQPPLRLLAPAGIAAILANFLNTEAFAGSPIFSVLSPGLLQLLAVCMMIIAGVQQNCQAITQPEKMEANTEPAFLQALRQGAPVLWAGLAFILTLKSPFMQSMQLKPDIWLWAAVISGLVVARQLTELGYNQRLTGQLRALETGLEERIRKRTARLITQNEELRREMNERAHIEKILREREEAMEHTAMHDALTGLPNRLLLMEHLQQAIRKLQRWENYSFILLFLDFDGFKQVNDRLGHLFGDKVLVAVAQRLVHAVREVDTVARLGGDEFVILLGDAILENNTCPAVDRIRSLLSDPYEIDGQRITLSASMGLVAGDRSYQQPAEILRDADLAMYEAKGQGKDRYIVFKSELRRHAIDRLVLEDDLRAGLDQGELELCYHPILSMDTQRITGFEALARWQHPKRGTIPPDIFIPIAETSRMILPVTRQLLKLACAQLKTWHAEHQAIHDLTVSVNLSPKIFSQPGALEMVDEILAETGLDPRFLKLEITEGAMVEDNQSILDTLHAWHERGIQIQMDDFGTGYASLSYLHRFPIDALKIDRTFIQRIQPNGEKGEITRTIITLARELQLDVIAEGVETIDQLAFLASLGCQYAQGYLIAQPLYPDDVLPFLHEYTSPALPATMPEHQNAEIRRTR